MVYLPRWTTIATCAVLLGLLIGVALAGDPPKRVVARVKPARDTTVVLGPLEPDGEINYETALNERMRGIITPDSNCVNLLFTAVGPKPEGSELHADFYKWLGRPAPAPATEAAYLVPMEKYFEAIVRGPNSESFYELTRKLQNQPWTAKEHPTFARWLAENENPLLAVTDASKKPDYFYPFIARERDGTRQPLSYSLLSLVQKVRGLAVVLTMRAMLHCGEKRYDAAWDDLLAVMRLGRLVSRGASLIEFLVGVAIDAVARQSILGFLEHARLTAKQLNRYRDDLDKLPPMASLAEKSDLAERFTFLDTVQRFRTTGLHAADGIFEVPQPNVKEERIVEVLAKLDWEHTLRVGNSWYDRISQALSLPTREKRMKALADINADLVKVSEKRDLTKLFQDFGENNRAELSEEMSLGLLRALIPSTSRVAEAADRHEQNRRTLVVAFALAAYHAEFGKYPDKLSELVPKYLASIPGDLYTEKELIFKRSLVGYEVYSVGVNGKDDGCQLMTDTPRGDDLGVRMPAKK